ncbi:MAG TPA: ectoine/hydroxyectoine ABC transporter permease subunit EhuD [Pseudonocardiaceae bacterium]|jgi:polar amino acid transport system permease protein|nr:ectoine/hydroxyectoine ABC transporter permease subunit EhuD [Pseudonocardiaceae bacterium]
MNSTWDWGFVAQIMPRLLQGLVLTVEVTVLGSILAYILGLVFALVRLSRIPVLSQAVWLFVEFVRSTPLLVQLYFLYFEAPAIGIRLSSMLVGVFGVGIHYATYTSEVYRAGIEGVPIGQWEAATALNLPRGRVWRSVILPQAIPRVLPALGNYTISMFKETPLLLTVGIVELVGQAQQVGSENYRYTEPYTMAGVLFLILSYPCSIAVRRLERRVRKT